MQQTIFPIPLLLTFVIVDLIYFCNRIFPLTDVYSKIAFENYLLRLFTAYILSTLPNADYHQFFGIDNLDLPDLLLRFLSKTKSNFCLLDECVSCCC